MSETLNHKHLLSNNLEDIKTVLYSRFIVNHLHKVQIMLIIIWMLYQISKINVFLRNKIL